MVRIAAQLESFDFPDNRTKALIFIIMMSMAAFFMTGIMNVSASDFKKSLFFSASFLARVCLIVK